jgi:hypothetical protein
MPDRHTRHIAATTRPCSSVVSSRGFMITSLILRLSSISDRKERLLLRLPRREPPPAPLSSSSCCWLPGICSSEADSSSVEGRGLDDIVISMLIGCPPAVQADDVAKSSSDILIGCNDGQAVSDHVFKLDGQIK